MIGGRELGARAAGTHPGARDAGERALVEADGGLRAIARVQDALAPTTFSAGLIKAPVFALLIALVGTYRGMQVRDSSRELGRLTTVAVVQSIFLVIFADAVFAIVFVELDF